MTPAEAAAVLRLLMNAAMRKGHVPLALAVRLSADGDRVAEAWAACGDHAVMRCLLLCLDHPATGSAFEENYPLALFCGSGHRASSDMDSDACPACLIALRRCVPRLTLPDVLAALAARAA